ncbi:MAG TPA: hypothetical protein VK921_13540 [Anditalea sp.]|nr:hypothetical protein [Anditalea sp.]
MAHKDNQDKHSKADADKDFGLPKVEITPLPSREPKPEPKPESTPVASAPVVKDIQSKPEVTPPEKQVLEPTPATKTSEPVVPPVIEKKEKSNQWAWISVVLILLLVFLGIGWFWYGQEKDVTEPEQVTTIAEPAVTEEPEVIEEEPETIEEEPETFTLTPIKSRAASPRYFVVVGSFIDEDMALDYSARLIRQNKNTYLVYPYGEIAYYRLAIGEYATLAQAVEVLEENQANFKENLWVLKY